MLISKQRHERELAEALTKATRLNEEILGGLPQGVFLLDREGKIRAPLSRSLEAMFRRRDLLNLSFDKLLESVFAPRTFALAQEFLAQLRANDAPADLNARNPLQDVPARITVGENTVENKHLSFSFRRILTLSDSQQWVVAVGDVTQRFELTRELEELRTYSQAQAACLSTLVRVGAERFAAFLRHSESSMNLINAALKKPARASAAFRSKLDEILQQIVLIKQQAAVLELDAIEALARAFEDAAMDLKKAESLSGSDFLPLAVRLDELFAQLALMRSMTSSASPSRTVAPAQPSTPVPVSLPAILEQHAPRLTDNGTEIIEAPRLAALTAAAAAASRAAPAGGLESALLSMTEHVAQANDKIVALTCTGLANVPPAYQGAVKNIVIQLIRNAVMHGIESPEERTAAGKPTFGSLTLSFERHSDESFQLSFVDDGRGLDAALLRETAVVKGIITAEAAEKLPDRQAIKLIFKKGFSTANDSSAEGGRGIGMALVRRYVAESGGRVALASVLGSQTRFRISLPPAPESARQSQVA